MQFVKMEEKTAQMVHKQYEAQYGKPIAEMAEKQQKEVQVMVYITVWIWHNFRYINMALVPVYAFGWLLATRKMRYSFLETLILSLFLSAHISIFHSLAHMPLFWMDFESTFVIISTITGIAGAVYNYWMLKQFYQASWLKTLFIYILGFTTVIVFTSIIGAILGVSVALPKA